MSTERASPPPENGVWRHEGLQLNDDCIWTFLYGRLSPIRLLPATLLGLGRCRRATGCLRRAIFLARTQVANRRNLWTACAMVTCGTDTKISALRQGFVKNVLDKGLFCQSTRLWLVSTRDELHTPSFLSCRQCMRQIGEGHDCMRGGFQDEPNDDCTIIGGIPLLNGFCDRQQTRLWRVASNKLPANWNI